MAADLPPAEQQNQQQPGIPAELLKSDVVKQMTQFGVQFQHHQSPPAGLAFIEKLQPEHITKVIDSDEGEKKRGHDTTRYICTIGIVGFLLLCSLFVWTNHEVMLDKVLTAFIGLVGGFAGGYGYAIRQGKK